jgi:TolA-binding protein
MFRIDVHHYFHDSDVSPHRQQILDQLGLLRKEIRNMAGELDSLKSAVEHNTTVDQSVITLVNGLAQQLRDMADSATELTDLKASIASMATELEASNQQVADVVTANTPATPTPPAP